MSGALNDDKIDISAEESKFEGKGKSGEGKDDEGGDEEDEMLQAMREVQLFVPGRVYPVVSCLEVSSYKLVCVHDPWGTVQWTGHFSSSSSKWNDSPEAYMAAIQDPHTNWSRQQPNGYHWMTLRHFTYFFASITMAKLFPNDKFSYYCVKAEWPPGACTQAGAHGGIATIQDRDTARTNALESKTNAVNSADPAISVDADASWFANPQVQLNCLYP
jgi:hypothetical protein